MTHTSITSRLALRTLLLAAVVAVVSAVAYATLRAHEWQTLTTGKAAAATSVARLFGQVAGPSLVFDDPRGLDEAVQALMEDVEVAAVRIDRLPLDPKQPTLVGVARPGEAPLAAPGLAVDHRVRIEDERVVAIVPILQGRQVIAIASVASSLAAERSALAAASRIFVIGVVLLGALVVLLLNVMFRGLVVRRLEVLETTSRRLAKGERITSGLGGTDEVGRLAAAVDEMARAIWTREDEVAQHHADLLGGRRRYEIDLRKARNTAIAEAKAKAEFLATMSHEIRTPLNGVLGMNRLLLDTPLDAIQREHVEAVQSCGEGLLAVVNDILDFSKLEAGKVSLEALPWATSRLLDEVVAVVATAAQAKGLELLAYCVPGTPETAVGDAARVRQVLLNLVSNAIKFTSQGTVVIVVSGEGDELRFVVSDTGCGIPAEVMPRLFSAFTQADSSTTRRYGGTGLGLAIVKRMVELMGGRVEARSSPAGSAFSVWLPRGTSAQEQPSRPLLGIGVVLALIPDPLRGALECILVGAGARVVVADANEALQREARGAQVVLALEQALPDLALPKGLEVGALVSLDALRSRPAGASFTVARPVRGTALVSGILAALRDGSPLERTPPLAAPQRFAGLRVLVAEDNPINQRVIRGLLAKLGCQVTLVDDGAQALARLERPDFDLILMDMQMPVLDGLETTRRLRASTSPARELPVVALTANVLAADRDACFQAGMSEFLSKPVRITDLAMVLARWGPARPAATP